MSRIFVTVMVTALITVGLISQANAEKRNAFVKGTCHLTILNESGTVIGMQDIVLTPVDPYNRFGTAATGRIDSFGIRVQLNVSSYDNIGAVDSDKVVVLIATKGGDSSYQSLSGKAFAAGVQIEGGLQAPRKLLSCVVRKF